MTFTINGTTISTKEGTFPLTIASYPKPYRVEIIDDQYNYEQLIVEADFLIIDSNILKLYHTDVQINGFVYPIIAKEEVKNMRTVLDIIDKMIENNISKGSRVIAIGGGIIQDLTACACALFRRGQPFCYMPTTTLGQLDSCVGAKCAVNTDRAKNILGLFSAPSEVIIPTFMVQSMPLKDHRAGLSEMLRLCLTSSTKDLEYYKQIFSDIKDPQTLNLSQYSEAIKISLGIKRAVVEYDEYETDIRRSMNFGHTFGHAVEKISKFSIPHGLAVLLGMLMSNEYAVSIGIMNTDVQSSIEDAILNTIQGLEINGFNISNLDAKEIINQFKFDKKGDGTSVPLIMIEKPGSMIFYKHLFDSNTDGLVQSIERAIKKWMIWIS